VLVRAITTAPAQHGTGACVMPARRNALLFFLSVIALATNACGCALWHGRAAGGQDAGAVPDASAIDAAAACPDSEQFFRPGCGSEGGIRITPGCYQPCAGPSDAVCAPGMICQTTDIDPCDCAPGVGCCGACGAQQWLCLPWHSTPTPAHCEGRDYCGCNGSCVPLIDLSQGCLCTCDDAFRCGGPPCDCDCGGATYVGCQFADRCATTQLRCEPPQRVQLVDGCPICTF
jgi:hypothetical protein